MFRYLLNVVMGGIKNEVDQSKPERMGKPAIYGLRRWKKERLLLLSAMASDRTAWKRLVTSLLEPNGTSVLMVRKRRKEDN